MRIGKGIFEMGEDGRLVQVGREPQQGIARLRRSALPITAVPTTMPSASKTTSARLPLGSVTRRGWSTR